MRPTVRLAALALAALGCTASRSDVAGGAVTPIDHDASVKLTIGLTSREFSERYERGDAAGMAALYTPDGVILPPGRHAIRGTAALTEYWTLAPGARVLEHRVTPDSIVVAGPVAYDWGTYRVRTRGADGMERETLGKYVIVWRETSRNTWRMHVDMWNASPR